VDSDITARIIGCAYNIFNEIGFGFLESVYLKCMMIELQKQGLKAISQSPIEVYYGGKLVGDFLADIIVENSIIIELKSVSALSKMHEVQLVNYLTAARKDTGLLINFGERGVEIKRKVRILPQSC